MPYRINDIDGERQKIAVERAQISRHTRAMLVWSVVLAGWSGLNSAWSEDLRERAPAAVRVVMPTNFCAPEVLEEHARDVREAHGECCFAACDAATDQDRGECLSACHD